jgi:hypothetical protein
MPQQQISTNPAVCMLPFWWFWVVLSTAVAPKYYIQMGHIEELRTELWKEKNLKVKYISMPSHFINIGGNKHNILLKIQVLHRNYKGLYAAFKM